MNTSTILLGYINAWGDVGAKKATDAEAMHPREWKAYKTWRYLPEIGLLMWWESPDEGEKMTVEDWLERKGYEINIRSVMGQKLRIKENDLNIISKKGTPIKRYKNIVGKQMGNQIYVHKSYAHEVIPEFILKHSLKKLKEEVPNFQFNCIMFNTQTNTIRFDESPDFDGAREPHVGNYVYIFKDGTTKQGYSNNIWHHKWLWVKDDYTGFNVEDSKRWSKYWISKLNSPAKGTDSTFEKQLSQVSELKYPLAGKEDLQSYQNMEGWKGKLIWISPDKFLKLAHPLPNEDINQASYENIKNRIKNQLPLDFLVLMVDMETKKVIGHEGRHRAKAAKELEVNEIPVLIYTGSNFKRVPAWSSDDHAEINKANFKPEWQREGIIKLKEMFLLEENSKEIAALDWLKTMVKNGPFRGKVFLAGGAVRDLEMGNTPKDLDVVVIDAGLNGGIDFATWLAKNMGNYKEDSNPVTFPKFGTAKVVLTGYHNGVSLDGMDVEAVASRRETYTPGSRKPDVVAGSLEDDVFRRDLTINSLVLDLTTDEVLDLSGKGKSDIKAGIIRTTSDPDTIFGQDALRIFRAIRFATKYNWDLAPEVIDGIKNNLKNLGNTSKERIRDEINKILQTGNPRKGFELLKDTGLLPYVALEFQQAVGMTQNQHHTEDVFNHTLTVLQNTAPDLVTRLMALFHDIGKVVTRSETPTGVHFYGHEDAGAEIAEKIMRDLKYPNELIQAVKLGVKNHMRLKQGGDDAVKLSDKALRKFKMELGDQLERVLNVIHADNTAHADASAMPNQIENVKRRLKAFDIQVQKPKLPINGNDIMQLGVPPGPMIGKLLSIITDAWYENPNMTKEDAIAIIKNKV